MIGEMISVLQETHALTAKTFDSATMELGMCAFANFHKQLSKPRKNGMRGLNASQ